MEIEIKLNGDKMMMEKKDGPGQLIDKMLEALDNASDSIIKNQYSDDVSISKFELVKLDIDANIMYREQNIELFDFIIDRLNKTNLNSAYIKGLKGLNEKSRKALGNTKANGDKIKREIDEIITRLKEIKNKDKGDSEVDMCNLGYFSEKGCDY